MKIHLLTIGNKMPTWVNTGYEEYAKRLKQDCQLVLNEIPLSKRHKTSNIQQLMIEEGKQLLAHVPKQGKIITMDVTGKPWSTEQLAAELKNWMQSGREICLLIGGPDGLSPECYQNAEQSWSLSNLTLPHPLVRIIVAEQIYRAWSILNNHPYHRS